MPRASFFPGQGGPGHKVAGCAPTGELGSPAVASGEAHSGRAIRLLNADLRPKPSRGDRRAVNGDDALPGGSQQKPLGEEEAAPLFLRSMSSDGTFLSFKL